MREYKNGVCREIEQEKVIVSNDEIQFQINVLKTELATYDYIGVKIAMGVATKEEYAEQIAYTETLRNKIRELEKKQMHPSG